MLDIMEACYNLRIRGVAGFVISLYWDDFIDNDCLEKTRRMCVGKDNIDNV